MTHDDYLLAESTLVIKGSLNLEEIRDTFNYALVQHNPASRVTRVQSLVDQQDIAVPVPCPRDNNNSYIVLTGNSYQSNSCCDFCINQIDCYILGVTKKFILASKYEE